MSLRTKKPSLAEKISSLVTAAPTIFGSDDENEETKAKVVENYDETESDEDRTVGSTFRKRNVDLLDQIDNRYKGKKVSRKDVDATFESSSDASEIDDEESAVSNEKVSGSEVSANDDEIGSNGEETDSDASDDSEIDEDNPLRRERRAAATNFNNVTPTNIRADVEKGNCVRDQLKIWENLLEVRIKLQKCLIDGNKMPQSDVYHELKRSDGCFKKDAENGAKGLSGLLENLLEMQKKFLANYPETRKLSSRGVKRKAIEEPENHETDEEICSDTEDETTNKEEEEEEEEEKEEEEESEEESRMDEEKVLPEKKRMKRSLADYEKLLADNHEAFRDYRNSVIQKWNDRTRVAGGSLSKDTNRSVVKQIEFVLGDKEKLIRRTRLKRSDYAIIGKELSSQNEDGRRVQDYDNEIYDDDDFYHQLLRELIEYKSSGVTDPVQLSKQWIALQNMRSKMKRKIDTRATKGRRVRYNVHTKLINFMAPNDVNDRWSDLAKNELYNSLFGKIKSTDVVTTANVETDDKQAIT